MNAIKKILLPLILILPIALFAQDNSGNSEQQKTPTSRAQRKLAKQKWKEERAKKRDDRKMVKQHHKRLQTKTVQKRMKKNKKKSERVNDNRREFFLKRWFKRK